MLAVRGANGSGKSTLLRLLAGLITPPSQSLFWKGNELTTPSLRDYRQDLLYIGHSLALHPEARVKDQRLLWQDLYGISQKTIEKALLNWGVAAFKDKKCAHLSQGQQKRLSLSRCSWLNRPLWILDEPQTGLDREGKERLSQVLSHHLDSGGHVIIATHESILASKEVIL